MRNLNFSLSSQEYIALYITQILKSLKYFALKNLNITSFIKLKVGYLMAALLIYVAIIFINVNSH